ncbi:MAG: hypothetical protein A4E37_01666 [Methanoregulaceae archaeon PtaB.Bin056]|nr:MAG: hypothetical protein A4E37_01666 [Methanoregulaceae archaeon PtaB.Bin056]
MSPAKRGPVAGFTFYFLPRQKRLFPMKHLYAGDTGNLLKYELIEALLSWHPSLNRACSVTMLTPDDGSGHGKRTDYSGARAGFLDSDLAGFLIHLRDAMHP